MSDKLQENENLNETAASDSLNPNAAPVGPANKAWAFGKIVNAVAGMDQETINKFVAMIDQIGHEADSIDDSAASKNAATIATKPSAATESFEIDDAFRSVIKEEVSALFEGDELSEEFKTKVETLIESAINMKVSAKVVEIEEAYETALAKEVEDIAEDLVKTLEVAVDSIAEQWLVDNEVAVVSTLRSELTEQFLEDLHGLFSTHYISVPEDKVDVVEEQMLRIEELEEAASRAISENLELKRAIEEATVEAELDEVMESAAAGLVATDAEKLRNLSESIEFTSIEDFKTKVGILKEAHFSTSTATKRPGMLVEETEILDEEEVSRKPVADNRIAKYAAAIERTIR